MGVFIKPGKIELADVGWTALVQIAVTSKNASLFTVETSSPKHRVPDLRRSLALNALLVQGGRGLQYRLDPFEAAECACSKSQLQRRLCGSGLGARLPRRSRRRSRPCAASGSTGVQRPRRVPA